MAFKKAPSVSDIAEEQDELVSFASEIGPYSSEDYGPLIAISASATDAPIKETPDPPDTSYDLSIKSASLTSQNKPGFLEIASLPHSRTAYGPTFVEPKSIERPHSPSNNVCGFTFGKPPEHRSLYSNSKHNQVSNQVNEGKTPCISYYRYRLQLNHYPARERPNRSEICSTPG